MGRTTHMHRRIGRGLSGVSEGGRQHWQPERAKRHHNRRLTDVTSAPLTLHRAEAGRGTLLSIHIPRQAFEQNPILVPIFP